MRKWLGLSALIPVQGMIFMDQTILPVALPTIQREFGAQDLALEWTVTSYLVCTAMFALLGGKIGDRIGYRLTLFLGLLLFAISSLLCGWSPSIEALILSRALQGFSAAMMIPLITVLFAPLFPESQRGKATGLLSSVSAIFMIIGPLIGGYLTEQVSWRWIFWINPPLCLIGFWLGKKFLPHPPLGKGKIDLFGMAAFAVCSGSAVVFFTRSRAWGWSSSWTLSCGFLALLSLFLLFYRERRATHPFLDLSLFKYPAYAAINFSISLIQFTFIVSVFLAI